MKLSLITEVFQTPSLDGVDVLHRDKSIIYTFDDKSLDTSYEIAIYGNDDPGLRYQLLVSAPELEEKLLKYGGSASIYLSATRGISGTSMKVGSFGTTGLGNHYFVYGKLIAATHDYVVNYNPLALEFSGSESAMDLMYDQMIKWSNKQYPNQSFSHLRDSTYIRTEIKKLIPINARDEETRKNRLEFVRLEKRLDRQKRLAGKSNPPIDTSQKPEINTNEAW